MENKDLYGFESFVKIFVATAPEEFKNLFADALQQAYIIGLNNMHYAARTALVDVIEKLDPYLKPQVDPDIPAQIYMNAVKKLDILKEQK